jgi:uncharacterized glyoxalase superfamily protein PhnB
VACDELKRRTTNRRRRLAEPGDVSYPGRQVDSAVVVKDAARFIEFVRRTFEATETVRVPNQDGTIGTPKWWSELCREGVRRYEPQWPDTPRLLSVWVDNVDEVVARTLDSGGTIITELATSRIIGDRGCPVKDPVGNIWWIQPIPRTSMAGQCASDSRTQMSSPTWSGRRNPRRRDDAPALNPSRGGRGVASPR